MKFSTTAVILGATLLTAACTDNNDDAYFYTLNANGTPGSFICQATRYEPEINKHRTRIDCVDNTGEIINKMIFSPGAPIYVSERPLQPGTFLPQETQ
jgi:hypothetical protein